MCWYNYPLPPSLPPSFYPPAKNNRDYTAATMELTLGPHSGMKYCLNITITPDTVVEANETLEVVLRTTDDYVTLLPSTATVSILDDDSTSCDLHGTCFGIDLGFLVLLLAMQAVCVLRVPVWESEEDCVFVQTKYSIMHVHATQCGVEFQFYA